MSGPDLIAAFAQRHNKAVVPRYADRESRNEWAATLLNTMPGDKLLNVGGGGKRHMAKFLDAGRSVHELDMTGDCDTKLNLDQIERLPFHDASFDISCAFDVLEHLEHFHLILDEMYRVSKTDILISLPNSATDVPVILRDGKIGSDPDETGVYSKFNGLPLAPPSDRHRWWLTFDDIIRFFVAFEAQNDCSIEFYIPDDVLSLKRRFFRFVAGERRYLNFFCSSVWIRIKKTG